MNRDIPPTATSGPSTAHTTNTTATVNPALRASGQRQWRRRLVQLCAAGTVSLALLAQSGAVHADDLTDKKKRLEQEIAKSRQDLNEYQADAASAAVNLQKAQGDLATAEQNLDAARSAQSDAEAADQKAAAELKKAQDALKTAQDNARKAKAEVDAWMQQVGTTVVQTQQQQGNLVNLAVLVTDTPMSQLAQRVEWRRNVMDSTQAKLDRLRELQLRQESAEAKATEAEKQVDARRQEAAQAYADAQAATDASTQARNQQASAVTNLDAAKKAADGQVSAEQDRQQQLQSESQSVSARIKERIRQEELRRQRAAAAAAKKKAEAEAAARRARTAAAREKARREAAQAAAEERNNSDDNSSSSSSSSNSSSSSSSASSSWSLIHPSTAVITSPFGQRYHPILHVWKLHDGTDFGASCGSPIKAAAAGTVSEEYFNAGYGNRLLLDHGRVNGKYLTTAYNHATRYIVSPGQHVSQGQVIGYVGSTGYSTGCHLHFMVYTNGDLQNPINYL